MGRATLGLLDGQLAIERYAIPSHEEEAIEEAFMEFAAACELPCAAFIPIPGDRVIFRLAVEHHSPYRYQ
jgi:hypothetical protein